MQKILTSGVEDFRLSLADLLRGVAIANGSHKFPRKTAGSRKEGEAILKGQEADSECVDIDYQQNWFPIRLNQTLFVDIWPKREWRTGMTTATG